MQQAPAKKKKKVRVPRVVNGIETMVEIEVDEDSGPGWGPNDKHTLLNHHLTRVDGSLKVTGVAQYTYDKTAAGMLYGRVLRSPHAHAKVVGVDLSAAQNMNGVKAVLSLADSMQPATDGKKREFIVHFAGEPVAADANN